tara:strand:- start:246 stop:530 length:285 start_codon:yes stop_codon:yes gene_type:complete
VAKRKKRITKTKIENSRLLDDIKTANPKDLCYFLDNFKKIWRGEIQTIMTENDQLIFQIIEEKESKYYVILASRCAFSEKLIKEIKSDICTNLG